MASATQSGQKGAAGGGQQKAEVAGGEGKHPAADAKAKAIVKKAMERKKAQAGADEGQGGSVQHKRDSAVQMADGGTASATEIHAAAGDGIQGGGSTLPHLDQIQASFGGAHDVSGVSAHIGGAAADACGEMGASAYAKGNDVAFKSAPDLHTAAHEAAHVVQQRGGVQLYGGVGAVGDSYEKNADAVADRVVAGQSASDLLGPAASGAGAAVQRKEFAGRPGNGGGNIREKDAGDKSADHSTDHYEIEQKAWIPHAHVVDPEEPGRLSGILDLVGGAASSFIDTLTFGASPSIKYSFHSRYRGDAHAGYEGGYRTRNHIEFDFDGTTVSKVSTRTDDYGESHRDYSYHVWVEALFGAISHDLYNSSGIEKKTATEAMSASGGGTAFHTNIASGNPLMMSPQFLVPFIKSDFKGTVAKDGLDIAYRTSRFPSHGVKIFKNGAAIKTEVINDASGVNADAEGPMAIISAINLFGRLASYGNSGTVTTRA